MRRVLPFLFMVLFANTLFAQTSQEKSAKYGTRPLADNPEPYLFINPDYTQSFRSTDVLVNMGGGSWISETSWSIVDAAGVIVLEGAGAEYIDVALSLDDGTYTVNMVDSFGDGWNGNVLTVSDATSGFVYFSGTLNNVDDNGESATATFDLPQVVDIPGCTDVAACNYDEYATVDDASCCFGDDCNDIVVDGGSWQGEVGWNVVDDAGVLVASGGAPYAGLLCLDDGTYTVNGTDSYGDGWNGNVLTILDSEGHLALTFTLDGSFGTPEGAAGSATFTLPLTPPTNALVLTAVLDMDLPEAGSTGKAVQVQAMDDIPDLSWYGVGVANNGGGTDGQEYQFPTVSVDSGDVVWLVRDEAAYANYFGADFGSNGLVLAASSDISQNGDDAIELYCNGTVVDLYGDLDVDGTGEAWEYTDSWAFRTCNVDESQRTPSTTFDLAQWTLGGPNCTDDSENNDAYDAETNPGGSSCPFPVDEVCDPASYGCTDPLAYGYDPNATDDDGSCYYDGDSCSVAITAVLGENQADGDTEFFQYTVTTNSMLTVSSQNATGDATADTYLSLHDGVCTSLALLIDTEGNEAVNDDCCGYFGPSTVSVYAYAGTVVTILWQDTWSPGPFTFTVEESAPPTAPQNLMAMGGVEAAYLEWEAMIDPFADGAMNNSAPHIDIDYAAQAQERANYAAEKKAQLVTESYQNYTPTWVNPSYTDTYRNEVTLTVGGGSWDSEITWDVLDANGVSVASGAAGEVTVTMPDGSYTLMAYDSFGDGWNGATFTAASAEMTYLVWGLLEGAEGMVDFTVSSEPANLTLANVSYDQTTDLLTVEVSNGGGISAWGAGLAYYLTTETSGECSNSNAQAVFEVPLLGAGETVTFPVTGIAGFLGYGTFTVGNMVDYYCTVPESNEEDNTVTGTIEIVNPLENIRFHVYRAGADAVFSQVATELEDEMYMDSPLAAGTYHYYVTQTYEGVESDTSNNVMVSVYGADDFPAPTDLMVEGNDYDAMLEWTAPDLSAWEPPAVMPILPSNDEKIDDPSTYINYNPADYSSPRQGGDTDVDATVIDALPYLMMGTTVGYTDDYDEECPYTGSTSPDVVYSFTSTVDTAITVNTCGEGSLYDTKLYVYEGAMGTLATTLTGDVACNDDFCQNSVQNWLSLIEGVVINANTTYYIVVDGYGGESGDYELSVEGVEPPPPPPAVSGYVVFRDGEDVAFVTGVENTTFMDEDLEDPENPGTPVTVSYQVAAFYEAFGMEGSKSNEASVTLPVLNCYTPGGLAAETQSNNVHLAWEQVPGQGGWFGHNNGELFTGIGAGAAEWEAAVLFGPEDLEEMDGMVMDMVSFIPQDLAESFKVFVYDPVSGLPVDSTELIDGASLVLGEWHDVMLPTPVQIIAAHSLMFGYRVVGLEGTFPSGADSGPAYQGYGDLIKGFGADWGSLSYQYSLDYNWMLEGHATFGPGRSISDMATNEVSISIGNGNSLSSRDLVDPIAISRPADRSLLGFNVHRGDHHVGTTGPGELMFLDDWVPWGEYTYHVTALYDHGVEGACSESEPASVEVSLNNSSPGQVMLQTPADGSTFEVTVDENGEPNNLDTEVQFFWTQANDPDNDVVHYHVHALGHMEGDTLMEMEAPVMAQPNPSWEDNADTDTPLAPWGTWPPENTNFAFETQGNGIYGSDATLEVYDGEHCLKVWGQYGETMPNVTPVYQGHSVEALGLEPGDVVAIEGHMMSHADDWVGQGANKAYLFVSFFNADWAFLGSSLSHMMDRTMPPSEWHQFFALGVVPDGAVHMNAGVEYHQESGNDHGSVYFDDVNMFIPVTQSIMRVSYEDMVMAAMEDSVHHMTVDWNVMAMDVWDATPSSNGPFQFTMDLSSAFEELGVDGDLIPDVYALHNNYPNPFNPVTNITYDIPEVANVSLDIYNVMGQKVRTLVAGSHEPGRYRVLWNATNDFGEGLSSGMYIYKIQAGDFVSVKKLILMK